MGTVHLSLYQVSVRLPGSDGPLFRVGALEIPTGSRLLIHGASGRGKTTFLHLLAGQFPPDSGCVRADGVDLAALDPEARARMRRERYSLLFQKSSLLEHLDALENVLLARGPADSGPEERAQAALARVGMAAGRRRSGLLSPGEQQRVALARILAFPRDVVLADEPTSRLDRANAESVMEALGEAPQGRTLVVVSHDERIHRYFDSARHFEDLVRV